MTLLQMSAAGGAVILAITVLRIFALHKFPKKFFLFLWEMALFRLALPFFVPSGFSAYSLLNRGETVMGHGEGMLPGTIFFQPLPPTINIGGGNAGGAHGMQNGAQGIFPWATVWLTGMVLCAAFLFVSFLHWYRKFRTSVLVKNEFVSRWLELHKMRRPVRVRQSGKIDAPLTYGIFHPVILMPETMEWGNEKQLECVLLHEYMHIRHWDILLKLAAALVLCVHWFNPMVWLCYLLLNRDIELACDEAVVGRLGEGDKAVYAMTLIQMEEKKSSLMPVGSHFSKNATEERITAIMKAKKTTLGTLAAGALAVAAIVVFFATSPDRKEGGNAVTPSSSNGDGQGAVTSNLVDRESQNAEVPNLADRDGHTVLMPNAGEAGGQAVGGTDFPGGGVSAIDTPDSYGGDGRMIFCMGKVYLSTGEDVSEMVAAEAEVSEYDSPYIGEIGSTVDKPVIPEKELQSNFGYVGSEVIFNGSGIAVNLDGQWIQFFPQGAEVSGSVGFRNIITRLTGSITCTSSSVSFTIPESGHEWNILINGRYEREDSGGMSAHFLQELSESGDWKSGETYSFPVDMEAVAELLMVVSIGEESAVIDLTDYFPESFSYPQIVG